MLDRGFFDPLPFYTAFLYALATSTILHTLYLMNKGLEESGTPITQIYKPGFGMAFATIFYVTATIFDIAMHVYLLYICGWKFLLILLIIGALLMVPARMVFGLIPFAQYLLPMTYILLAMGMLTYFGIIHLSFFFPFNIWLHSRFT